MQVICLFLSQDKVHLADLELQVVHHNSQQLFLDDATDGAFGSTLNHLLDLLLHHSKLVSDDLVLIAQLIYQFALDHNILHPQHKFLSEKVLPVYQQLELTDRSSVELQHTVWLTHLISVQLQVLQKQPALLQVQPQLLLVDPDTQFAKQPHQQLLQELAQEGVQHYTSKTIR